MLAPAGDLDFASAAEAHKLLLGLRPEPGGQLLLDLRAVTFMDSTGIRLVLHAHEHALRHGASLVLLRGPEPVMRVLALVGLEDQLEIVDEL